MWIRRPIGEALEAIVRGALVGSLLLAASVLVQGEGEAQAVTCPYQGFNTQGAAQNTSNNWISADGMKASVWVNHPDNYVCSRVASIAIYSQGGDNAEFGWGLGLDCKGGVFNDTPRYFLFWYTSLLGNDCVRGGHEDTTQGGYFRTLKLTDDNGYWQAFIGSSNTPVLQTPYLALVSGKPLTNGERHLQNNSESAWSHFDNLQYLPHNGGMQAFPRYRCWDTRDYPDYGFDKVSATESYVSGAGVSC